MRNEPETNNDLSQPKSISQYLRLYFSGFAMGSADIVPGVSGGTMAFILGIYETLIDAIKSFDVDVIRRVSRLDIRGAIDQVPLRFLFALGAGILTAGLLLANVLHTLLKEQPTFLFAFFAGLIVASIVAIGVKVKWSPAAVAALVAATAVAFAVTGFDDSTPVEEVIHAVELNSDVSEVRTTLIADLNAAGYENAEAEVDRLIETTENGVENGELLDTLDEALASESDPLTLFFSGMLAICAMILPGISGSFILLIIGQYATVLAAVKNLDFIRVIPFGIGAVIGIMLFSRVLSWLLKRYENVTIAALVGFMVGSMRKIWIEAADGVDVIAQSGSLTGGQWALVAAFIAVGFLLVSFLDHLQSHTNPVFALVWKEPRIGPADVIAEKAEALE